MAKILDRVSVKVLVCACVAFMLVGIVLPLSASAAAYDLGVTGAQTISTNEAADLFGDELGWTEEQIEAFKTGYTLTNISSTMVMAESYDGEGNLNHSYQFWYDEDGEFQYAMIDGSGALEFRTDVSDTSESGGTVESPGGATGGDSGSMGGIITIISNGVKGVFKLAGEGFNFIVNNALCMFMVAISFAGVALGFVARAIKTSRK